MSTNLPQDILQVESDTRLVVDLLCAKDEQEEIRLMWLIRDQEEEEEITVASCQCGETEETVRQAIEARIGDDGTLEFFNECLK